MTPALEDEISRDLTRMVSLPHDGLVRAQTTITLPEEILAEVGRQGLDRSRLIERALRAFLGLTVPGDAEARDREIPEAHAEDLNREAEDAREYQVPL